MKKFRIVAMLLVLVLATSCFAAGTFAKYTSYNEGGDSAIVAKWSILVKDSGDTAKDITTSGTVFDLFVESNIYDTKVGADSKYNHNDTDVDDFATSGYDETQIIAPGTWGYVDFVITNASEVTAEYGFALSANLVSPGSNSIPLDFHVSKVATGAAAPTTLPADGWDPAINTFNKNADLSSTDTTYQLTTNTANAANSTVTYRIFWKWDFSDSNDPGDTALGIEAIGVNKPTANVSITYYAEQVD